MPRRQNTFAVLYAAAGFPRRSPYVWSGESSATLGNVDAERDNGDTLRFNP